MQVRRGFEPAAVSRNGWGNDPTAGAAFSDDVS